MLEEEIYEKEKKYLRYINILIILNIFMVIVVVLIYLNINEKNNDYDGGGRLSVGQMPPKMHIRLVNDVNEAKSRTLEYIEILGLEGLSVKRVVSFKKYFYVYVKENESGKTAFALKLINLGTFSFKKFPSMYPQIMWNDKYGDRAKKDVSGVESMLLSLDSAKDIAEDVAKKLGASYSLTKNPDVYYGFFEFIVFKNKIAVGEISINGTTGKVFFKLFPSEPIEFSEFI